MTIDDAGIGLVLLDIEGTTTPITFVYDVLFPFCREHAAAWLHERWTSIDGQEVARALAADHEADVREHATGLPERAADPESAAAYVHWLMDRDRKTFGLKLLQGYVWRQGYAAGALRGEVYADVPRALRRWRDAGRDVAIYSSGSELAQRLLFASVEHGDLTPLISGFFDTAVGAKTDPESYVRIVDALSHAPSRVLFVSDVTRELEAARTAGCQTRLISRPGNPAQPAAGEFVSIRTFDDL